MRIAVNTRLLLKDKLEGIGWFTYETLKRITQNHPEHQFYFIFDRPFHPDFIFSDNITPVVAYPPARHPYLWYLFFEYGIPYQLKKIKPDLFLSTDGWMPLHLKCKTVNVIHDINFEHHPEFITQKPLRYYKKYFHQFAEQATRIATVSEFSKIDIHKTYHIDLEKIDVVYNGCNPLYRPLDEIEKIEIRTRYANGNPYFLFVGLVHKRKNLENLFKAFDLFKITDTKNTKFVIVGSLKGFPGDIENTYLQMRHKEDVIFLGRKEINELIMITGAAEAMLYVSLYEGFGIPILEGFQAEIPVITSNTTSMPEIAKDAAILADPYSVDEINQSLIEINSNNELRLQLIQNGKERKMDFSWDMTSQLLWNTIEKTLLF
jgi:glycosyltransferase involved in cell wall biosynthesis